MTDHKNIYMALAAAQSEMGNLMKGAINPHFRSSYSTLSEVVSAAREALARHGIAFFHTMAAEGEQMYMKTILAHGASETTIECAVPLVVDKNNMQGMKSATTYAKRIGLESLTGLAPQDDDGNAAAAAKPMPKATVPQLKPRLISISQVANLESMLMDKPSCREILLKGWNGKLENIREDAYANILSWIDGETK